MLTSALQVVSCNLLVGSLAAGVPDCSIVVDLSAWAGSTSNVASVADAGPGSTYVWQVSPGAVIDGQGTPNVTFAAAGPGAMTVSADVTDSNGLMCADISTISVQASIILNEYNAVGSNKFLEDNGEDTYWGRIAGNGDDWFELIVIQDHLDVRGWQLLIQDATPDPDILLTLTTNDVWANLRSGTIVTISEDLSNNADEYSPPLGRWWLNVKAADDTNGTYLTASDIRVNNTNWQLTIRNATGVAAFGPAGEGVRPIAGVGSQEVCKLEEQPSTAITPLSNYQAGDSSTFGSPNQWNGGASVQDLSVLRSVVPYSPMENVRINEVLTHTDLPVVDWVELYNTTDAPVEVGGWYLSDGTADLMRHQIPTGVTIPPHGYVSFEETELGFAFNSAKGEEVLLSAAGTNGVMTGARDFLLFGAAAQGTSFGRYPNGTGGLYTLMPPTREAYNAEPLVGPVVINEIMYHPPDIGFPPLDNVDHEFVELHNLTDVPVGLATYFPVANVTHPWRLRGGVDFDFPLNASIAARSYLLIVSFDPTIDALRLADFRATYGLDSSIPILGPYAGKLSNLGETVRIRKPDTPQPPGSPDEGFVPQVLVDEVSYTDRSPWPTEPDGSGASLERVLPDVIGDVPENWRASSIAKGTPGAVNTCPPTGDQDNSGVVDLLDFQRLSNCFAGPGEGLQTPRCTCFDGDGDGDVDLHDIAVFQVSFDG